MANPHNLVWHPHRITGSDRARLNGQRPFVIWFTGLSGSGKSTLAGALEERLFADGHRCYLLDGDNIRHGLNRDLGFGDADRVENIRRVGELSKILVDAGLIVIAAFISPFARDRAMVRHLLEAGEFVEVHLNAPLEVCEQRDPKGIYKKARSGEIKHVTGVDSPYESPADAEVVLDTSARDVPGCVDEVLSFCRQAELLAPLEISRQAEASSRSSSTASAIRNRFAIHSNAGMLVVSADAEGGCTIRCGAGEARLLSLDALTGWLAGEDGRLG